MSLHSDAVAVLRDWAPPTPDQARLAQRYLQHLDAHPDAMLRSCRPDHLTASVLIFSYDCSRVLLTLHRKIGRWLQTGGHCEETDGGLADAALREGREESGIPSLRIDTDPVWLSLHEVAACGPGTHHLDVQFVAVAPADARYAISVESADLGWFSVDFGTEDCDDSVRELIAAGAQRLRGTL